jgi:ribosome-associated toxin RatA of RatAB toxin-antitoxin module
VELRRTVLVPFSAEGMFDLIERAEAYPQFLPWCVGAKILERSDEWVAARLEFDYHRLRFGFQTRNPKRRPEWLEIRLVEGPFKRFHGEWNLTPLGEIGRAHV